MTHLMQIEEYPSKSLHGNWRVQSIFVEQIILLDSQLLYLLLHYYHPFLGEYVALYSVYQTHMPYHRNKGAKKRALNASKEKQRQYYVKRTAKHYRTAEWLQPSRSAVWSRRQPVLNRWQL